MSQFLTPEAASPGGGVPQPVTISFAGFDRAWAAWIGGLLERRGHGVVLQRWDPSVREPLADSLRDLTLAPGPVLIVLSRWYVQLGPRTHEEWNAALREVAATHPGRFAAVSVTTGSLPTATSALAAVNLTGIGADEAERRVLARLGLPDTPVQAPSPEGAPRFPLDTSEVWGGVPRRNTRFTGRERILTDAHQILQDAARGTGVVTLHGMPGVGKTQLAAEYVYRFGSEYDVVWWVDAESRASFRLRVAELATALRLDTGPEYGERLRAVRDALRRGRPYGRWLLVLDGADEPHQISDLVPTGPGHVLITSRNPEWGEHNSRMLEIGVYDRAESVAFVRRRAPRLGRPDAQQLAEALGDLPLLLDQTAGWLNDSDLSVDDYIALLEGGIDQDIVKVSQDFPLAFQTAWSILLNKLRETVPESVALLGLCTFFAPGTIPVRILRDLDHQAAPEPVAGLLRDPLLWNRAVNQLRQYSVVSLDSHEFSGDDAALPGEAFYLHRMVHQIVHRDLPEADRAPFAQVVRAALAAADPGRPTDTRLWPRYAEIVPHLEHAQALESTDPAVQNLVLNCLRYLYLSGEYKTGVALGERTLEIWRRLVGDEHPRIWDLVHHYANLLRAGGDFAGTEAIERAATERLRALDGPRDLAYLRSSSGLAADLRGLGRYEEAYQLSTEIMDAYGELLGDQDSRTLSARNNVAVSLRLLGHYQRALVLDKDTMERRRELLRPRHNWTLSSEHSYALDLRLVGRYKDAESLQARNVREQRLVMGRDNPVTLDAEHNLALCHYRLGDREAAGLRLADLLDRCERTVGENHPLTLRLTVSQSCHAREHGDVDLARELSESVLHRYTTLLGPGHPFVAGVRANHALVLRNVGERRDYARYAEQAYTDMARAVGELHPWTLGCALNVSAVRNVVGDPEAAAELSRATVDRATEALGRTHPLTLSARIANAADLRGLRRRKDAEKIEDEALQDFAAVLGAQHVHTISARSRNRPYWDFEPYST
ncbi:FxSxx-COOH system tetratricopeptide repeat protein [Streptomyces albidoflavus]|uniref:FxSxx-COOH system tetratricopeptide repeat protein n=1 Tax=Streptomyces albidoflavus TaxID=1886 RepID=UPI00339FA888